MSVRTRRVRTGQAAPAAPTAPRRAPAAPAGALPAASLEQFDRASREFLENPSLHTIDTLRAAVAGVLARLVSGLRVQSETGQDRMGRTVQYHVIQAIEQELIDLEKAVQGKRQEMSLMARVGRLRGLLLDLYR